MGVDFLFMLEASFYSSFRIFFISFSGYLLVKSKIINKQVMKGIAEMTANFLIPCLSVAEICKSFHIKEYAIWLPILIYCLFNVGVGYLTGLIISSFIKNIKPEIKRLILIVCMFSNSTSMQLIYVESLGSVLGKMINKSEVEAKSRGYVIVLIYTIFVNFLRWSVGFNMMKPDRNDDNVSRSYLKETPMEDSNIIERGKIERKEDDSIVEELEINKLDREEKIHAWMKIIKEGINMPFIAGVAAILISSIPHVNTFFSNKDSIGFKLLTDPCEAVGKSVSVLVILILGLNLSISLQDNSDESEPISKTIISAVLFVKAIIFPLIGLFSVWFLGCKYGFVSDPLLCFLLLTNFCTPTAINMITIAIINKFQVNNLSKLLIYQYLMGMFTITIWTAIYMNLFL